MLSQAAQIISAYQEPLCSIIQKHLFTDIKYNCWQRIELVNVLNCLSLNNVGVQNNTDTFSAKYSHEERLTSLNHLSTRQNFTSL